MSELAAEVPVRVRGLTGDERAAAAALVGRGMSYVAAAAWLAEKIGRRITGPVVYRAVKLGQGVKVLPDVGPILPGLGENLPVVNAGAAGVENKKFRVNKKKKTV